MSNDSGGGHMRVDSESLAFFSALASKTRLNIVELVGSKPMSIRELADALGLSSAIIARHVDALEEAGIVLCNNIAGARGLKRECSLRVRDVVLSFKPERPLGKHATVEVPVGQYSSFSAQPTCGLSTARSIIGEVDDPRYFVDPARAQAGIVWLGEGYLEYLIPNYMTSQQRISALTVQMEICSEAPGFNNEYPSDIYFSINGVELGFWTSPGDFGDRPGLLTPDWWVHGTQYGMLKTLAINEGGCFIDGTRLSGVAVADLKLNYAEPIRLRIASPKGAANPGGFVLFGSTFGNYNQDIRITMEFADRQA